jgi:transcriptional regulator with XRE-family HTH domain
MQVIATWSGPQADLLRQAFRMTNESFADHLGVSARTVANWRGNPEVTPRPATQEILDSALERAPDRVKAQFALLIGPATLKRVAGQSLFNATNEELAKNVYGATSMHKVPLRGVAHGLGAIRVTEVTDRRRLSRLWEGA